MDQNQKTPNTPEENQARFQQNQRKKKIVKIALICCVVIVVLYVATMTLNPDDLVDRWFHGDEHNPSQDIQFYPIDEDLDILSDPEYLEYDHRVFYYDADSGATYSVEEEDLPTLDPTIRFFHEYFQTIILGDEEGYAACFVSDYDQSLPENFTMQMVYDIYVQPYYSEETGENTYRVEYKIHKNNGTFRNDMGSDVSRALLFVLRDQGSTYRIEQIIPFTNY